MGEWVLSLLSGVPCAAAQQVTALLWVLLTCARSVRWQVEQHWYLPCMCW